MSIKKKLLLLFIIAVAAFFRFQNINWDQGYHLHPDERAIVMFTLPLSFPNSIERFFSPQSPLNPHFFAYGNFPLYFLKIVSLGASMFNPSYATYDHINLLGRYISVLADIGTLFFIFLIGKKISNVTTGILGSFFYAISVLPIQLSHFYAVDTLLTFFIIVTLYFLVCLYEHPTIKNAVLVGIFFGFSLATKISALVLISAIGITIALDFLFIFLKRPHHIDHWYPHVPLFLKKIIKEGFLIIAITLLLFVILEPYALIDSNNFLQQTLQQNQMTHNAFTFPYTLQYVGKTPYIYELKNIFFWGLGPVLAIISFCSIFFVTFKGLFDKTLKKKKQQLILLTFFWIYFFITGRFAIGFMRYVLPLYPLLCLFAGIVICSISIFLFRKLNRILFITLYSLFFILLLIWPVSFLHIYSKPNTRVLASSWINKYIPKGTTIAIEHWDDALPLYGTEKYRIETLELYNPDTREKWNKIKQQLSKTDYIIIASNRLYVPLQKLVNCNILPANFCYRQTAAYYHKLFDGELEFKKVAEFSIEPQFSILNFHFTINDQRADESFTVYDHPKVTVFKKSLEINPIQMLEYINR